MLARRECLRLGPTCDVPIAAQTGIQTRRLPDAKGWVMPVWEAKSA